MYTKCPPWSIKEPATHAVCLPAIVLGSFIADAISFNTVYS